jgi:hypothetical protein
MNQELEQAVLDQQTPDKGAALSSSALLGQSGRWFSYDPDNNGFEIHDTEAAARKTAEEAISYEKEEASSGGWSDSVTQICWGKVAQKVEETMRKKRPPEAELDCGVDKDGTNWGEWDEIVDYDLCPNARTQRPRAASGSLE